MIQHITYDNANEPFISFFQSVSCQIHSWLNVRALKPFIFCCTRIWHIIIYLCIKGYIGSLHQHIHINILAANGNAFLWMTFDGNKNELMPKFWALSSFISASFIYTKVLISCHSRFKSQFPVVEQVNTWIVCIFTKYTSSQNRKSNYDLSRFILFCWTQHTHMWQNDHTLIDVIG